MPKEESVYIKTKDFLVSHEEFSLVQNEAFGFLETKPCPQAEDLSKYYESEEYISHTDSKKGLLSFLYQSVKTYSLKKKVSLISRLNEGKGSLLDIGAGTGEFLKVAQEKGWSIHGVEVSEKARDFAKEKNVSLEKGMDAFAGKQFDVVSLWHVLEHLPDLEEAVHKIEALVRPGGNLIIAVPNFNSWDAKHYKEFWAAYDVPRHLWHFSQSSMRKLISEHFKLVATRPMPFDAFYVSLLSEKYKTGNSFSLKAFWKGFRSNLSAMSSKEYSSLLYCFQKEK
ncbi:class I SAM-dependent methyltransferase [Aureisphaera galaxeae]|nr:class I SAM-dependent methyltransferase [Aureisphaera galaxeae]MDC8005090.1 class I SAM-dependent methyltransferase [Aureisphaera galaxeae]